MDQHRSALTDTLWLIALPALFLALFYFWPLAAIMGASMQSGPDIGALLRTVTAGATLRVLGFTVGQALLSTALTVTLALPGAYLFARYDFPGKRLLTALTTVPFVLPTVVVAVAFTALLGPRSPLNTLLYTRLHLLPAPLDLRYTFGAILLAHIFYNYAVVLRMVSSFWAGLDPHLEEAARALGASPWRAFREVTLPLLLPALGAAALLVFIFCFTSFGVILILGGPRFATLEVEIYRQTVQFANLPQAALLSLLQIDFTLLLLLLYARLQARMARPLDVRPAGYTWKRLRRPAEIALAAVTLIPPLLLLGAPLVLLAARSFDNNGMYYAALLENSRRSLFYVAPLNAVRNSLALALATTALALVLGTLTAQALRTQGLRTQSLQRQRGGWILDALFMLPLGTSAVTLGLGYLLALSRPPLALRGAPILIVCAHTLVALPFVVRNLLPALQALRPTLREAAQTLGAPPLRVFLTIELPLTWRALAVGAIFAFTISMGEFGATSLIARPDLPTLPIAIFRYLGHPGALNYGQAMAMATLLMGVCGLGFLIIEWLQPPDPHSFL